MDKTEVLNYNLTCSTDDGRIADWIARELEERIGRDLISATGMSVQPSGNARIMTVIKDPLGCPPYKVLEFAEGLASRFGVGIVKADIVGDISLEVVLACAGHALSVSGIRSSQIQYGMKKNSG